MLRQILLHITLILCLIAFTSKSQAQDWPKIYGDNIHSLLRDLSETYDKGYILTAFTYDQTGWPEYDWIIKTDINGEILWDKWFGDGDYSNGMSKSFITNDNGIILCGSTSKYSGNYDPTFIKMDVCGEIEWCRVLLSPDQNYATGIIQLTDGSYIGMLMYYGEGAEYARISLIKLDQAGEPVWIRRLAQEDSLIYNEEGYHLLETYASRCLVSGRVFYPGMKPYWILTDTAGEQIWDLKWSGITGICFQTIEFQPGIYYSIGYKIPPGYPNLPAIYKFSENGNELDDYLILGDTLSRGGGKSILKVNDSTLLTGVVWGNYSMKDEIFHSEVVQIDTMGNLKNRRLLLLEDKAPSNLILTSVNKLVVAGYYVVDGNWDIYLWKMNQDLEDDSIYTQPITYDSLCPYPITSDTVDLDCNLFVNIDELPTKEEYESTIKISPNPATNWISLTFPDNTATGKVELSIYDLFGRKTLSENTYPENRLVSLRISDLPSGIYLVVASDTRNQVMKGKFIVAR
jgi:hypothetical protein